MADSDSDGEWKPAVLKKSRGGDKGRKTLTLTASSYEGDSGRVVLGSRRGGRGVNDARGSIGRGRARTKGRGYVKSRTKRIQKIIMIIQHVRDILRQMTERYSSLLFDIQSTGGYNPEEDVLTPDWCSCQSCREMPSDVEKVCCGKSPDSCISRLPAFQVLILEVEVLVLMYVLLLNQEVKQRANRHQCYRRYMLWQHGRLGAGVRKVIPSCCVWRIRDRFPDRFGQYTGFVPGRLG